MVILAIVDSQSVSGNLPLDAVLLFLGFQFTFHHLLQLVQSVPHISVPLSNYHLIVLLLLAQSLLLHHCRNRLTLRFLSIPHVVAAESTQMAPCTSVSIHLPVCLILEWLQVDDVTPAMVVVALPLGSDSTLCARVDEDGLARSVA